MALEGTIQDFGLADIFQLIGIQRKTGVLTLENDRETVLVKFVEGNVVGADNVGLKLEDLLGSVLVRTGRLAQPQLDDALATQQKTLQRLGFILIDSGYISEVDLKDALYTQVTQIVYRLFRWRDGRYKFDSLDHVDYDQNFSPISAETILMEGARMVDEWPIIERRIKSDQMVFRKTDAGARVEMPIQSIVDADIDLGFSEDGEAAKEEEIRLSDEEREILRLVDGVATVQEIADRTTYGEFDAYRLLCELQTRNLIEEAETREEKPGEAPRSRVGQLGIALVLGAVLGAAALGLVTLRDNPFTPWGLGAGSEDVDRLRTHASRGRIERIERAIQLCFMDTGELPYQLSDLAAQGYLSPSDLLDPWGREYVFRLDATRYTLSGRNSEGAEDEALTLSRRFSAAQRLILAPESSQDL